MNIFVLDSDIDKSVEAHFDKHVVKMPLEAAQMISTTMVIDEVIGAVPRKLTGAELVEVSKYGHPGYSDPRKEFYRPVNPNHPCNIWARTSIQNFEYLYVYMLALGDEYTHRYDKVHQSVSKTLKFGEPCRIPEVPMTPFAQAMPEEYKSEDAVESYRTYYMCEKAHLAAWKRRKRPEWWG